MSVAELLEDERESTPAPEERAALRRCFKSFPAFCSLLKVTPLQIGEGDKEQAQIPMRLTWIQKRICAERTSRVIVLKPRRVYVTTLEVAYDLFWFLTVRGARVIIVCQTTEDHGVRDEIAEILRGLLASLREHVAVELDVENNTYLAMRSRDARLRIIEAGASVETAKGRARGITVNRLHATEMGSWRHGIETMTALLNAMPQDPRYGSVTIESTANGAAGYFYERWREAVAGKGNFKPLFFPWHEHDSYRAALAPGERVVAESESEKRLFALGVSPEAVKWKRLQVGDQGPQKIAQEYPDDDVSCFLVSGRGFFDGIALQRLLANAKDPIAVDAGVSSGSSGQRVNDRIVPAVRIWHLPVAGRSYVVGSDTSDGTGGSAGTGIVVERGTGRHMATLWGQFRPWVLARHLASVGRFFNDADLAVERNNTGLTVLRALEVEEKYKNVMLDRDGKPGLVTSTASRGPMLDTLEEAVRVGAFGTSDVHLVGEMRTFVVTITESRERPEHAKGARDDLVLGTAIAWEAACRRRTKRDLGNLPAR